MKLHLIALFLFSTTLLNAQEEKYANSYITRNGYVHFFSKSPLEDIEAHNRKTVCVFNTSTQKVYVKVPIKSFQFKQKLMQDHFNENYLESDKYPHGILNATIINPINFDNDGDIDVILKGTLDIHGVKQERELPAKITIKNGDPVKAVSNFDVALVDHKIKIPKAVIKNIAEIIKVDLEFDFEKYEKKEKDASAE
jgi:hypothetical protein